MAHIHDLPNEMLMLIFSYNYRLIENINCSYVCKRWRAVLLHWLTRIKGIYGPLGDYKSRPDILSVEIQFRYNLTRLMPNVTIMDNVFDGRGCSRRFIECVQNFENLRAVCTFYPHLIARATRLPNRINSVSTHFSRRYFEPIITQLGAQLKQIHFQIFPFEILADSIPYMPSLIRIHLQLRPVEPDFYYRGPRMENLRQLELVAKNQNGNLTLNVAFDILNYCPKLKSAYFCIRTEHYHERLRPSTIERHENLEDLVIMYYANKQHKCREFWGTFLASLEKFPNLKHLAIRLNAHLPEHVILIMLERFDNLRVLDLRGTLLRTEWNVREINARRRVPVDLNLDRFGSWRTGSPKMNPNLDFMEHCFHVNMYEHLPKLFYIED